jgi:hypothetical protein
MKKFLLGINDTGEKCIAGVNNILLPIISRKIGLGLLIRGQDGGCFDEEKKCWSKIS